MKSFFVPEKSLEGQHDTVVRASNDELFNFMSYVNKLICYVPLSMDVCQAWVRNPIKGPNFSLS